MRTPRWTPSNAARDDEATVYLVMVDRGDLGLVFKETEADHSDLEAVIQDLLEGQYKSPVRIIGFNVPEGWARDISADVALEVQQRCDLQLRDAVA